MSFDVFADPAIFLVQLLNATQQGLLLFLIASGLTLIFGIMGIINLAHGSFYMVGAYAAYAVAEATGSFWLALPIGVAAGIALGYVLERLLFRFFYERDHLYQVLLTFGLILIFEEVRGMMFGEDTHRALTPEALDFSIPLLGVQSYPAYRLAISVICLLVALGLYLLISRTRLGMMIRAGAYNREMVQALGINITFVYAAVFGLGTGLAALAGLLEAPVASVEPGISGRYLIISFVVVVIGGIGSVKGAFYGALLIGFVDTFAKVIVPEAAGMSVYLLMAAVLLWRPTGLFGRPA
ncbi:MAG: branched-chain amino acid ABC transporter permease [Pseudomonadota bacterium]